MMSNFAWDMPEFRDEDGTVYVWDAESHTYVRKPSAGLEQDRGHSTGGDNDLFNQNQIEHSELAGVPELEGHMAHQSEWAPKGKVKCPQCSEVTDQTQCPVCHKDLTPEWNAEQDSNNEFFGTPDVHSDASEYTSWPERVPKRNREKTDDSYPSMMLSRYEKVSQDVWDNIFAGDAAMRTEIGKWLIDKHGALHFMHGMNVNHEDIAKRDRIQYPTDVGALGSIYNDGTADVQMVSPDFQFDHDGAQAQIEQTFGPVTLAQQVSAGGTESKGPAFQPFIVKGGQWVVNPHQHTQPITGVAWVKERPEGQTYAPNMILVAEHLQPEDFQLWSRGVIAIITATGGLTSHAAYLAMTEGIPVVVGLGEAYNKLETGDYLKIEPNSETITVMPGASGDMSSEQKKQISDVYMQYQKARGGSLKPQEFAHIDEELAWRQANTPSLDECPECRDPMADQDGEKVCHSCGHKQPILHTGGAAALAIPVAEELGGGLAGGLAGGAGGAGGGAGLGGLGSLMNSALGRGIAFRGGENMVGGGQPGAPSAPGAPSEQIDTGSAGVISHTAGVLSIIESLFDIIKKTPEAFVDPKNPLSYADDIAGVASGANQLAQQGTPPPTTAKTAGDDTFGEEETGWATKNRGDNSDPEEANSSGAAGKKEQGDGPEQLKDVDGIGGPKSSDAESDLIHQGDPALQEKALKAFHLNLPLIIEFANSDEPGSENPILVAIDQIMEEAFPGYKDGTGEGEDEHPVEEINVEVPSNDGEPKEDESEDESGEKPEEGDSKEDKKPDLKAASVWEFVAGLEAYQHWNEEAPRIWWEEEGRHSDEPDYDPDSYLDGGYGPDDAFAEEVAEMDDEEIQGMLNDPDYLARYPGAKKILEVELQERGHSQTPPTHIRDLEGHGGGMGAYSAYDPNMNMGSGAPAPAAGLPGTPATTGVPTCPMCGQSHLPGTPCPTDPSAVTAPAAAGGMITPPAPNKVITKWQIVEAAFEDAPAYAIRNSIEAPTDWGALDDVPPAGHLRKADTCPSCGFGLGPQDVSIGQCPSCGGAYQGQPQGQPTPDIGGQIPGWPEGRPANANTSASVAVADNEFAFFMAAEEGEPHSHEHRHDGDDSPWTDETGAPLQKGAQYELKSSDYAIPDRITVDRVLPDKLVYTTDAGEVKYRNEITAQDVATNDYSFAPVELDNSRVDSSDGFQDVEAPVRPGQDALPQVDDLSTPQTTVSRVEGLEDYTGSFHGDTPDGRSWLLDGDSSGVDVDPVLMAKLAGKDYSPREQREFIDEKGEARNLDRLDLAGTHYLVDDAYGDTLW